jgi:hypothetical protein
MATPLNANDAASVIAEPDSNTVAEPSVTHLTTIMTVEKGNTILVTCDSQIELELSPGVFTVISAATPITITAQNKITLSPATPLGQTFGQLWKMLPTELKYEILRYNLVIEGPYGRWRSWSALEEKRWKDAKLFPSKDAKDRADEEKRHEKSQMKYFAMGPEIAPLARRVFYENNNFSIGAMFRDNMSAYTTSGFRAPNMAVRPWIKHVTVDIHLNWSDWESLQSLAEGDNGFENLKTVHIITRQIGDLREYILDLDEELYVEFKCIGRIELRDRRWSSAPPEDFLSKIRALITFAGPM